MVPTGPRQSHINVAWAADIFGISLNAVVNRQFDFYVRGSVDPRSAGVMLDVDQICVAFSVSRENLDRVIMKKDLFFNRDQAAEQLGIGRKLLKRRRYRYVVDAEGLKRFSQIELARQHVAHEILKQQRLF